MSLRVHYVVRPKESALCLMKDCGEVYIMSEAGD